MGTVLTETALSAPSLPAGAARGYRLLYVTRDQRGVPVTSTGALYLPPGQPPAGGGPVFSWAHGTSGIPDACSPSASTGVRRDALEPTISKALRSDLRSAPPIVRDSEVAAPPNIWSVELLRTR
ncbi:hypothetical protein QSJ19_09170 [Gordonia sp. ABSL11-1]|uniref:hypothetical protein n=1 Tax=Gordonia sp. ABSL11-1 TaxID=3053924 RepID=UPI0025738083|nr:hypothetical protein [Gordonia sp. ABSL11-1]MDL9945754.1 hypothetical protein [Gordonia sp. ABSL11-1]